MTQIYPAIRSMSPDETQHYGLINPGLILNHETTAYRLTAGTTDTIYIFQQSVVLFVLTINHRYEYVAIDAYIGSEDEPIDSIFIQGEAAIQEFVGVSWRNLSLEALISRLTYFLN